jgi:uncharacterized membrane protein
MKKIILGILSIYLIGCSEEIAPERYTYSQIISGKNEKTWRLTRFVSWIEGKSEINLEPLPPCISDDLYTFYADLEKKYEVSNGVTKCNSSEPDLILVDTWSFINGGATLNMILPFLSDTSLPFIVRELDNNTMALEIFRDQENTISYRIYFESVGEN